MSNKQARFERRLAERRAAQEPPDPVVIAERRNTERRQMSMSPREVEDWLRQNGITGGDRRKGDRRRR